MNINELIQFLQSIRTEQNNKLPILLSELHLKKGELVTVLNHLKPSDIREHRNLDMNNIELISQYTNAIVIGHVPQID